MGPMFTGSPGLKLCPFLFQMILLVMENGTSLAENAGRGLIFLGIRALPKLLHRKKGEIFCFFKNIFQAK